MQYLIHNIDNIENIYDLLVLLFKKIEPNRIHYLNVFQKEEPLIEAAFHLLKNFTRPTVDDDQKQRIKDFIIGNNDEQHPERVLLSLFSNIVNWHYSKTTEELPFECDPNQIEVVEPLNSNYTDEYLIYPVERTVFYDLFSENKRISPNSRLGRSLDEYLRISDQEPRGELKGLLIFKNEHGGTKLDLRKIHNPSFAGRLRQLSKKLTVASIPIGNFALGLDRDSLRGVATVKIIDEEILTSKVMDIMCQLSDKQIDVIIFPELVLTVKIKEKIQEFLLEEDHSYLFVVPGSIWADRSNRIFLLNRSGQQLLGQSKIHPYRIPDQDHDELKEDIDSGRSVNLLDISGFGRVSLTICADFIHDHFIQLTQQAGANIFLGALYSPSMTRFQYISGVQTSANHAMVFLTNACQAIRNNKALSVHQIPAKSIVDKVSSGSDLADEKYNLKCKEYCQCSVEGDFCYILSEIRQDNIERSRNKEVNNK